MTPKQRQLIRLRNIRKRLSLCSLPTALECEFGDVFEAPRWLKDRVIRLQKEAPPTLEEMHAQAQAAQRVISELFFKQ
jgi:hypothetical protein